MQETYLGYVTTAFVALLIVLVAAACGGSGTSASAVAAAAGASRCDDSGYALVRATGDDEEIYDCAFDSTDGLPEAKCVTYQDGIANDATAVVRLAFTTKLGAGRPSCLTS